MNLKIFFNIKNNIFRIWRWFIFRRLSVSQIIAEKPSGSMIQRQTVYVTIKLSNGTEISGIIFLQLNESDNIVDILDWMDYSFLEKLESYNLTHEKLLLTIKTTARIALALKDKAIFTYFN